MASRQTRLVAERDEVSKYHGVAMSEAAYLALPEEKPYLEYVDGVVQQKPMPDSFHRRIIRLLNYLLESHIRAHGGDGGPEGRVRLPDGGGYRLPDTAYWVPGRYSGNDSVPSLVVEVMSSGQRANALRDKCRSFRANGVDACWLMDPYHRWVEVFEGARDGERLAADGALETPIMPGFSMPLSDLWAVLDR